MSLAHHGCSAATAWLAFPSPAAPIVIGSSTGGPMLLNMRTSAMLRPSMTAKMTPPTMPACNAAFDPPRDASTAPVQKPDICHVTCHYVSPSVPPRLPASSRPAVRSVSPLSLSASAHCACHNNELLTLRRAEPASRHAFAAPFNQQPTPCALECGAGRGG